MEMGHEEVGPKPQDLGNLGHLDRMQVENVHVHGSVENHTSSLAHNDYSSSKRF